MNDILLTFDVDWAPNFMIRNTTKMLIDNDIKSTWFITHDSPAIQELFDRPDLFEVGIHPNFMPGTTQGNTPHEVMEYLMKIAPNAKSVRTHGLFQSSNIMKMMATEFGIENDTSTFLREMPNITPIEAYYDDKTLLRVPYYWTEDGEMYKPNANFLLSNRRLQESGLKVFAFHPIHIYLNSCNMTNYNSLKQNYDLKLCTESQTIPYVKSGIGTNSFFQGLLYYLSDYENTLTLLEFADNWKDETRLH